MEKVILIAIPFAAVIFAVQSWLFRKFSRKIVHWIPVFVVAAVYLISLALVISDLVVPSGCVKINTLYALILSSGDTVALLAVGTAWLIEKV